MSQVNKTFSFDEANDFLNQIKTTYDKDYKLDNVILLFKQLNIYSLPCHVLHVTGTNGKGSTCAMLESIYRTAGLKTGLFSSPHLISFFESIKISNQNISEEDFLLLFNQVYLVSNAIEKENPPYRFSFFEYLTAIAILYFVKNNTDVIILEVGMGGRIDATNALEKTTCSIFTTISLDHEAILGNSLEEIAKEKSGIIRPNTFVFLGYNIRDAPRNVINEVSIQNHCKVYQPTSVDTFFDDQVADYQNYNATTAKLVAQILSQEKVIPIQSLSIDEGIRRFHWPARWQKFEIDNKIIIFDGAHNEEGALAIQQQIERLNERPLIIFGSNKELRAKKILKILLPICKKILISKSSHERALSAEKVFSCIESKYQNDNYAELIDLNDIPSKIKNCDERIILVTGSLYLIGDIMKLLNLRL